MAEKTKVQSEYQVENAIMKDNPMSEMIDKVAKHQGQGAQFWAYVSPQFNTENIVTKWTVKIEATDNNWAGSITSDNPKQILQTPNLSGIFKVTVTASGAKFSEKNLSPTSDSKTDIGCNSNCAAMVGIVATADGTDANYWTVWDALC